MITITTSLINMHIFLTLTGHAFDERRNQFDPNSAHGFWWAWRWLRNQVRGGWLIGDEDGAL